MNPTREELEHFLEPKEVDRLREAYLTLLGENECLKKAICPECDKEEIEVWVSLAEDGRHALDVNPELVDENEFRERQQNRLQVRLKELLDENERLKKKEQLSFESMVDHHEAETAMLNGTIRSQAAVVEAARKLPISKQLEHRSGTGYEINHSHDIYYHCDLCVLVAALRELDKHPQPTQLGKP